MGERVRVEVDEDLADLVPDFLGRKRLDLEKIRDAASPRNYAEVGRLAHKLKGDGRAYGFDQMSTIGLKLEEASARRDDAAISSLTVELLDYIDNVEIVYCPMEE